MMRYYFTPALLTLLSTVLLAGCLNVDSQGRIRHKQRTVSISSLDWVEFVYSPAPNDPLIRYPVKLELWGSGSAKIKTGPSPQVLDDFSHKVDDPNWNSILQDTIAMPPEAMEQVLQTFVDNGLIPLDRRIRVDKGGFPRVAYQGTIHTDKFIFTTDNAILCDVVKDFLETNFEPILLRARSIPKR